MARALQNAWAEPSLGWGIDTVVAAPPRSFLNERWPTEMYRYAYGPDGAIASIAPGPYGDRVVRALHRAVAALGAGGLNVIVDQVLLTPEWGADLRAACAGLDLLIVHVYCSPNELARRERSRADRTIGQALAQRTAVAQSIDHDLLINTAELDVDLCANRVLQAMTSTRTVGPSHR